MKFTTKMNLTDELDAHRDDLYQYFYVNTKPYSEDFDDVLNFVEEHEDYMQKCGNNLFIDLWYEEIYFTLATTDEQKRLQEAKFMYELEQDNKRRKFMQEVGLSK